MEYKFLADSGKIIIINDAPKFTDYLKKMLAERGYRSVFVNNMAEARQLFNENEYDAIIFGHEFLLTEKTRKKIMDERATGFGGEFIIINDSPALVIRIAEWMKERGYRYVFVDSLEEADRLQEQKNYDTVMYGHEFIFTEKSPGKH